jgi:predicted lipoprotein with Yx(FWY)xxD motif
MRRTFLVMIAGALVLLASTAARAWASAAAKPTVQLRQTARGKLLVDRRGFTLYVFSRDSRNHDACVGISGCTSIWPVLKAKGAPVAGPGVKPRLLGTISVGHGARQVTYAGHPLYGYIGDSSPGQTSYVGFNQSGGRWYAITGSGKVVK